MPPLRNDRPLQYLHRLAVGAFWVALAVSGACTPPLESTNRQSSNETVNRPAPVSRGIPLKPGAAIPKLEAEGWINAEPTSLEVPGTRLMVVDWWADWCPFCRHGAPELVQLHKKFSTLGVVFVSLTNMPRGSVESFVKEFGVTWPNGYGGRSDLINGFGVGSGIPQPGYGIAPTLFIIGRDGRVLWNDQQARFRHVDVGAWSSDVAKAIENALNGLSEKP